MQIYNPDNIRTNEEKQVPWNIIYCNIRVLVFIRFVFGCDRLRDQHEKFNRPRKFDWHAVHYGRLAAAGVAITTVILPIFQPRVVWSIYFPTRTYAR